MNKMGNVKINVSKIKPIFYSNCQKVTYSLEAKPNIFLYANFSVNIFYYISIYIIRWKQH